MARNGQLWLALGTAAMAVLMPTTLTDELNALLTRRRCPPPVLNYPDAPDHRVLLAGEPYGLPFPWPSRVQRITGSVLLPPTATPRGVLTWEHRPGPDSLRLCREIDVVTALRALQDPPSVAGPVHF